MPSEINGWILPGMEKSCGLRPGTNLAAWLDSIILTPKHMWRETKTWDPEGILSTLPSISTCLFGLLAGGLLKRKELAEGDRIAWHARWLM